MTVLFTPTPANETDCQEFDDGDAPSMGSVNPLGEAAFNTAKYAANRVGAYRLLAVTQVGSDDTDGTTKLTSSTNAWGTTPGADLVTLGNFGAGAGADCFELSVDFVAQSGADTQYRLEYALNGGAHVAIPYARILLDNTTDDVVASLHVGAWLDLTAGTAGDSIVFYLNAKPATSTCHVYAPLRSTIKRYGYNS